MKYRLVSFDLVTTYKNLSRLIDSIIYGRAYQEDRADFALNYARDVSKCVARLCEKLIEKGILDSRDLSDVLLNNSLESLEAIKQEEVAK